jgi:DNA-binding transcriptional ArsR family regulator
MREMARRSRARKERENPGWHRADLIDAIAHPLRRRILRLLADRGEQSSPARIAKEFELHVGTVGYHVKVLEELGAAELTDEGMVRGAVEHFYKTAIVDDPPIETLLEETREVDDEVGSGTRTG